MDKKLVIRNSTAEFLIFQMEGAEGGVQVFYRDETVWCTQPAMAQLFDVGVPAISKHLKNIFESGELISDSVVSKMEITAADGKNYSTTFYNLEASGDAVLEDAGNVSAEFAQGFAESEFEKYRLIQDRLFLSDFDRFKALDFDQEQKD